MDPGFWSTPLGMPISILPTIEFPLGKKFCVRTPILPLFWYIIDVRTHISLKRILGTPTYIGCLIMLALLCQAEVRKINNTLNN